MPRRSHTKLLLIIPVFLLVIVGALALAEYVLLNPGAQALIAQAGYLGVVATAIIAGLNAVVPVPAATFTPLFTAAGLSLPLIIAALVVGTVIADLIGFWFGRWSRDAVADRYPRTHQYFTTLVAERRWLVMPMVIAYAAFVPFPNEAILIPLAIAGVSLSHILPAVVIGNIIHQAYLAVGFSSLFAWWL
jgi:membrane protein DedA with SNARE-associated domain